jgi:hypothetical protein
MGTCDATEPLITSTVVARTVEDEASGSGTVRVHVDTLRC